MRENLLKWLICPVCEHEFKLEVISCNEDEIEEGGLECRCDQKFPIISGVPRLVCDGLREELEQLYPDFFTRNSELIDSKRKSDKVGVIERKKATMDRFGYEWLNFSDYNCDNFEPFISPLPDDFFKGKLGLDVGCGAGRHALQVNQRGAEIIAIDLSQAVDAAQKNNIANKQVHIIQADVYNLPFKPGIFDFIYSLGVLHHLPEPEKGYRALLPFLCDGGSLFIWLYAFSSRKIALEILRVVAQRLSNHNIRRMAYICNLIDYGIFINLFRVLQKIPVLNHWVRRYTPLRIIEYANHGFRVSYTDWFDRLSAPITNYFKEDEMKVWLEHCQLENTRLLLEGDSWWWLYGERKAES
jgi:SAM-dependent methyltransferase/uncharacterized protein YbaR (Trm112 family)